MWTEPKTNWTDTDYFNYTDYNRIKNNIEYLRSLSLDLYLDFPYEDMGDDKTGYADFPYADEFNVMENNLESMKNNTFGFYFTDKKQWYDNQPTPNYEDLNRIESACLKMYDGFNNETRAKGRLSVRLGYQKGMVKV